MKRIEFITYFTRILHIILDISYGHSMNDHGIYSIVNGILRVDDRRLRRPGPLYSALLNVMMYDGQRWPLQQFRRYLATREQLMRGQLDLLCICLGLTCMGNRRVNYEPPCNGADDDRNRYYDRMHICYIFNTLSCKRDIA